MVKTKQYDPADYLDSPEVIREYLQVMLEENDTKGFQKALGDVARAKGMSDLAKMTGLSRQNLYKALSVEGRPHFETIYKIIKALGCDLKISA